MKSNYKFLNKVLYNYDDSLIELDSKCQLKYQVSDYPAYSNIKLDSNYLINTDKINKIVINQDEKTDCKIRYSYINIDNTGQEKEYIFDSNTKEFMLWCGNIDKLNTAVIFTNKLPDFISYIDNKIFSFNAYLISNTAKDATPVLYSIELDYNYIITSFKTYLDFNTIDKFMSSDFNIKDNWTDYTIEDKESIIYTATRKLDFVNWEGDKCEPTQELAFPRNFKNCTNLDEETYKKLNAYNGLIPVQLTNALLKLIQDIILNSDKQALNTMRQDFGVKEMRINKLEFTFNDNSFQELPERINNYLSLFTSYNINNVYRA